jgi:hypothetical protein
MMTAFRNLITEGGSPWITPGEIMRTVAAVEAAYRSMRSGGWTAVDMSGIREREGLREARA